MEEPGVYNLYLPRGTKLLLVLVLVAFSGAGVGMMSWSLLAPDPKAPPLAVGLIWLAIAAINLFYLLSIPHRITLAADGTIEFISLVRRRTLRAEEIRSIKPAGSQFGFLLVRTERSKIRIPAQFDGFHDFLTRLQALHPGVELRGC